MLQFKHTLVFACPKCKRQIIATKVLSASNLEAVDAARFDLECTACKQKSKLPGLDAKEHKVEPLQGESPATTQ